MSYPQKFDTSYLDKSQLSVLADFYQRRKLFDNYLNENKIELYTCPGCGYPTLTERGGYQICSVCNWEDDNQDDKEADEIWGGPNDELSLTENRLKIGKDLKAVAEQFGGETNTNPSIVLNILSRHEKETCKLFKDIPDDADINHPIFEAYKNTVQLLLRRLVAY